MGNSLLSHYIDNYFKKGIILWGQKHFEWGGKVEVWGGICPSSSNVKKGSGAERGKVETGDDAPGKNFGTSPFPS